MKYRGLLLPMILAAMCGDDAFMLNTKRGKGILGYKRTEPPVLQSLESPALSNSEMPFRGRKTGQI